MWCMVILERTCLNFFSLFVENVIDRRENGDDHDDKNHQQAATGLLSLMLMLSWD